MAVISGRRKRMNTKYSSGLTRPRVQMIAMMTRGITQGCGRRNVEIRKQTTKTSLVRGSRRWRNEAAAENWDRSFMRTPASYGQGPEDGVAGPGHGDGQGLQPEGPPQAPGGRGA